MRLCVLVDTQSRFSRQAPTSSKVGGGRPSSSSVATEMVQSILCYYCSAPLHHRHTQRGPEKRVYHYINSNCNQQTKPLSL